MTTETAVVAEPRKPTAMPLVFFPDAKLLEVSKPVSFLPYQMPEGLSDGGVWVAALKEFGDDLVATMQGNNGVGLSAIQVGAALRIIVVAPESAEAAEKAGNPQSQPYVMVNPQWLPAHEYGAIKAMANEGCLSFPGLFEDVERWTAVHCQWSDVNGKYNQGVFYGVPAQVIQHECEHLDGHLLIEHLPTHKRNKVRLKMKQRARLTAKISKLMAKKNGSLQSLINAGLIRGATNRPGFRSGR